MPPAQGAAPTVGGAPAQGNRAGGNPLWTVLRMAMMWYFFKNFFGGSQKALPREEMFAPKFQKGLPLDLYIYLTEQPEFRDFKDTSKLVWKEAELPLATASERKTTITYWPSKAVHNNGTLYLHAYFLPSGLPIDPTDPGYDASAVFGRSHAITKYAPRPKRKIGVNLLSGEAAEKRPEEEIPDDTGPPEWISFFKPNITIALLNEFNAHPAENIPPHLQSVLTLDFERMSYFPGVFFNDFWLLKDYLIPMNETVKELPLHLSVQSMGSLKYMLYTQMEQSFKMQTSMGALGDGEQDEFKRVILEGNPYLLGITAVVSLLHSVFDMLAFKNDIGFWRNKKNVEGLSVSTILINCFCQVVILLYLLDNETSFVILASSAIGTLIEFWKITRAVDVSIDRSGRIPRLRFKDKAGYSDTKTKQYDAEAMRYLSYVLYPLLFCYAIYALLYETHRSWHSYILNTLVGAVYTFGFILMCPQLYLNYRLKSVAHLPWRQMTYKFLTTIVDDLAAFCIKMPALHRLSVFRDDLVFLVYIYQRYAYRVDKKRTNEYGFSAEPGTDDAELLNGPSAPATEAIAQGDATEAIVQGDAQTAITEDNLRHRKEAVVEEPQAEAAVASGQPSANGKKDK